MVGSWLTADAPTKAELTACVECGLCLPVCPTFRLTGRETASPRGRIVAMRAVAAGAPLDAAFEGMMTYCLQCRACEAVCPSLAPFGRMMEGSRAEIAAARSGLRLRLRHRLVGKSIRSRRLLRFASVLAALGQRLLVPRWLPGAVGNGWRGLRRLPWRSRSWAGRTAAATGDRRGTAALVAGCVMDAWFPEVHDASVWALRGAGFDVVVPRAQTCCGALAAHDGAADAARRMAEANVEALGDVDLIVADAAGCGAHLKGYGHWAPGGAEMAAKVRDITEVVADAIGEGRLPAIAGDRPVAVQDPCHLRHAQRVTDAPRRVLEAGGFRPVELDPDGLCCGAAGLYSLREKAASAALARRKADLITAAGVEAVASANPGCEMQLRSHLPRSIEIRHPVELYVAAVNS